MTPELEIRPLAEHEVVALEVSFAAWLKERAVGLKVVPFLYYSVEHITKQFDLTDEEINYGITDHSNDGGIDALYCLAGKSNKLIRDDIRVRTSTDSIRIMVFQCKSSLSETGFKEEDIDSFARFADALLSIKTPAKNYAGIYQPRIITLMQIFKDRYLEIADSFPRLFLEFYLVTRGDGSTLNAGARAAEQRLRDAITKHRGPQTSDVFNLFPVQTQELLAYVRQRRERSRIIKWARQPLAIEDNSVSPSRFDGYIGLVRLHDYCSFLQTPKGELDELIFESNVRGHQGRTSVNRQMRKSLDDSNVAPPDFWQLNNGVTITCSRIDPVDVSTVQAHDPQVVNGLQTSRQIFGHFSDSPPSGDVRTVLVKLIPVTDGALRDRIIRATNNQNPLGASALRTTDDRHREIEDSFAALGLYYDRRPGFYKDMGKQIDSIVSVNEVVQAVVSLVLHRPNDARGRPGDYIKEGKAGDEKYKLVFGTRATPAMPLGAYYKCVSLIRSVRDYLSANDDLSPGDRTNLLFYVAYHAVCEQCKNADPTAQDVKGIITLTDISLKESLSLVERTYRRLAEKEDNPDTVARGPELLNELRNDLVARHGIRTASSVIRNPKRGQKIRDIIKDGIGTLAR